MEYLIYLGLLGLAVFAILRITRTKDQHENFLTMKASYDQLHADYRDMRELFEIADTQYKQSQEKIQDLTAKLGYKDVVMSKGTQALETSNVKMRELLDILKSKDAEIQNLEEKVNFQDLQYSKLLSQKKSSEVRTGKITEQISPFLADYPLDPKTARFIGDPIDFVHFNEDKITFVEVKSGKSQLSSKQRRIRDLVAENKVDFQVYRVKGDKNGSD